MKSAKAREAAPPGLSLLDRFAGGATMIMAYPRLAAGTVTFAVLFSFFCGNAIFSQVQKHPRALFATRDLAFDPAAVRDRNARTALASNDETRVVLDRKDAAVRPPADPKVEQVQTLLGQLGLYDGVIDGISGPKTQAAVSEYQKIVGLPQSGDIDKTLMDELLQTPAIVSAVPTPRPADSGEAADAQVEDQGEPAEAVASPAPQLEPEPVPEPEPEPAIETAAAEGTSVAAQIARIQAGLRAFGHDDITIDGVAGERTKEAIREFQSLFRLSVTGEPDPDVEAKMREIGLVN